MAAKGSSVRRIRPSDRRPLGSVVRVRAVTQVVVAGAAVPVLAVPLTGCAGGASEQGESQVSRVELYTSLQDLAADSPVIVAGTAGPQQTATDVTPDMHFTLTSFTVAVPLAPAGDPLGGPSITVRQVGSADQPAPVPLLVTGQAYLLFLTPSGLSGPLASHYYVTGASAGLYRSQNTDPLPTDVQQWHSAVFEEAAPDPADDLPDTITVGDVPR